MSTSRFDQTDIEGYYKVLMAGLRKRCRPNLFGVGAARCGTSLLYELLKTVPDVYVSPIKEVNYFGVFQRVFRPHGWSIEDYERLFLLAEDEKYLCEISPIYLSTPGAGESIYRYAPDAKIMVTLREPLDRLISQFRHYSQYHCEDMLEKNLEEYIDAGSRAVQEGTIDPHQWYSAGAAFSQSFYADNLRLYMKLFGRENICILIYEDLRDQPEVWLNSLSHFLDIEINFHHFATRINESQRDRPILSSELVQRVTSLFTNDIEETSRMIDVDLISRWYQE